MILCLNIPEGVYLLSYFPTKVFEIQLPSYKTVLHIREKGDARLDMELYTDQSMADKGTDYGFCVFIKNFTNFK